MAQTAAAGAGKFIPARGSINPNFLKYNPQHPHPDALVWRQRFPEALACTSCGRLLASRREAYNLTDAQRLEFVCGHCRIDAAEAEANRAGKVEALKIARAVRLQRRLDGQDAPSSEVASGARMNSGDEGVVSMTIESDHPRRKRGTTTRRGGRPVKHVSERERKQAARDAARAYRANRKKRIQPTLVPA